MSSIFPSPPPPFPSESKILWKKSYAKKGKDSLRWVNQNINILLQFNRNAPVKGGNEIIRERKLKEPTTVILVVNLLWQLDFRRLKGLNNDRDVVFVIFNEHCLVKGK